MKRVNTVKLIVLGLALMSLAVELPLRASAADASKAAPVASTPDKIIIDGSTTVGPIAKAFAEYYMALNPKVGITVSESGSGNGAKSIVNGTCDIATMSRFMKETEFKAAVDNSVFPVAHAIAMDGIVMVVHPSNPVKALTTQQVHDIYSGKAKNWKDVGGPDLAIVRISRDTNSGTYETFETLVMKGDKMAEGTEYVNSNGQMREKVQSTTAAVGYVGLGFVDKTVKALEINGIMPDKLTIATGRYPISRPLFMFTNGYPRLGSHLHAFVTLYLSKKGQEIIESTGFIPLTSY
jgi:phosphate transport system substrate-binding protein